MLICKQYNTIGCHPHTLLKSCSYMGLHIILAFLVSYVYLSIYRLWYKMELSCTLCLKVRAAEAIKARLHLLPQLVSKVE